MVEHMVAIKNVKKEVWNRFKSESAKHNLRAGELLQRLLDEHQRAEMEGAGAWKSILTRKPLFTKQEAEGMISAFEEFREGFDFRE
jgi:hypothetical protein